MAHTMLLMRRKARKNNSTPSKRQWDEEEYEEWSAPRRKRPKLAGESIFTCIDIYLQIYVESANDITLALPFLTPLHSFNLPAIEHRSH